MSKGLLIDYEWCSGCHTCEVACRKEHGFGNDEYGIKITEYVWPRNAQGKEWQQIDEWQYTYFPMPLDACDLCAERVERGKLPTCVHHCQAQCITYGDVEELAAELAKKPKQTLFCLS